MTERFDDFLAELVNSATDAAAAPGSAAARARGKQRRNRHRLAASTLALVLLAGVGGVAANAFGDNGGAPVQVGRSSPATATPSPTGVASTPPSIPPATPPAPTVHPSTANPTTGSVPSPSTIVPGAWIPEHDLPYANQVAWTEYGDTVEVHPGGSLAGIPVDETDLCELTGMAAGMTGSQTDAFAGPDNGGYVTNTPASQVYGAITSQRAYFYSSSAAATAAWGTLPADYAVCATQNGYDPTTGVTHVSTMQRTLDQSHDQCWTDRIEASGASGGGSLTLTCFVRSGSLIGIVYTALHQFNQNADFSAIDASAYNTSTTHSLQAALAAYPGPKN
jgi:hypothetical protein